MAAGTAVLGTNLVDQLTSVVDDVRASVLPGLGVRRYRVYTVLRTWTGGEVGAGTSSDVENELIPSPRVGKPAGRDLGPLGTEETDEIELTEVSLKYTEAELLGSVGGGLGQDQEWFYRIADAYGQNQATRRYTAGSKLPEFIWCCPFGWRVRLRRADGLD